MENQFEEPQSVVPYPVDGGGRADLLDKIRPEKIIEVIKNKLMGRELDLQTNRWKENPALSDNAVSELCANDMSILILSVSNPNTSISKLKDQEIRKRAYSITKTAVSMLLTGWERYEITNSSQLEYVSDILYSLAFITMKQADNEGIRKMIVGTRSEIHQVQDSPNQGKGLFGRNK